VDAVLSVDINRHVHEFTSSGSTFGDLDYNASPISAPLAAPGPINGDVPDVIGYVRADSVSAVIYRSEADHVIEIAKEITGWVVTDLTSASGTFATVGRGGPFPYVRTDGYSTAVYVAMDNHIHELAKKGSAQWFDGDLSVASGDTGSPGTDPWAYQRSDGFNSVLYTSIDGHLHEIAFHAGGSWGSYILPAVGPSFRPSGYVRGDGISTVVYVSANNSVHELALVGGAWSDANLPIGGVLPVGQVFGHKPPQRTASVLFQGTSGGNKQGVEISLNNGTWSAAAF
jgi:hypothetical protein